MDAFSLTVLILFAAAVVGTIVRRRSRDACLKKFQGAPVWLQLKSGEWIEGVLSVRARSLEITHPQPQVAGDGLKLSCVLMEDNLPEIQMILRACPPSGSVESVAWRRELHRVISPSVWGVFRRWCRNLLNTARDALSQLVGLLIGRFRGLNPGATLAAADQKIADTGQMLVAFGSNAYEPILEDYLGRDVVVELVQGDRRFEHLGTLEEYTERYVLTRNGDIRWHPAPPPGFSRSNPADVIFPRTHAAVRHLARRRQSHENA